MSGDKRRKRGDGPSYYQHLCKICKEDIGVETSSAVEYYYHILVNEKTGKPNRKAANRKLVCAYCLMRGKLTPVP